MDSADVIDMSSLVDVIEFHEGSLEEAPVTVERFATAAQQSSQSLLRSLNPLLGLIGVEADSPSRWNPLLVARRDASAAIVTSLSPSLDIVAIVAQNSLQIRRAFDRFKSVKASWTFPPGSFAISSWRKCVWSAEGDLIAVYNFNKIFVFTKNAALIHTLDSQQVSMQDGIADVCFKSWSRDTSMIELVVLGFDRTILRLIFQKDGAGAPRATSEYANEDPKLSSIRLNFLESVSTLEYHDLSKIVAVGGNFLPMKASQTSSHILPIALIQLDDGPAKYFSPVYPDASSLPPGPPSQSSFLGLKFKSKSNVDASLVWRLRFSPSGAYLAVLELSGALSILDTAKMIRVSFWSPAAVNKLLNQGAVVSKSDTAMAVSDVKWWNETCVILLNAAGVLAVIGPITGGGEITFSPNAPLPRLKENSSIQGISAENVLVVECFDRVVRVPESFKFTGENTPLFKQYLDEAANYVGLDFDSTPQIGPQLVPKKFRFIKFVGVRSSTPELLFQSKVEHGDFVTALDLASKHHINTDLVFQRQFSMQAVSKHSVDSYLRRVKDLWWRLRECKERVPSSAEGALALFDYGLEITLPSASGAVTLEEKEIALHRLLFLLFKERLAIYCSLVGDRYQGDEFLEFRSRNLSNVCVTLIENGELERAQLLLDGSNDVAANLLHILANVSELLDPKQYRALLPDTAFLNNRVAPAIKSSADPVVAPASIASLGLPSSSISNVLARLAQLHFHKVRGTEPGTLDDIYSRALEQPQRRFDTKDPYVRQLEVPEQPNFDAALDTEALTVDDIGQWYYVRAKDIESRSGVLENAVFLAEMGLARLGAHPKLNSLLDDFKAYHFAVYGLKQVVMPFSEFELLSASQRVSLLLCESVPETIVAHIRQRIFPLFSKEKTQLLLSEWMVEQGREGLLDVCHAVLAASPPLISTDQRALSTALECCYACEAASPQTWAAMEDVLSALPAPPHVNDSDSEGDDQYIDAETNDLWSQVDELEERLAAIKLFSSYNIHKPLHALRTLALPDKREELNDLLARLCQTGVRARPAWKPSQWEHLLEDLKSIVNKSFAFLGPQFAQFLFFKTLLKANQFQLARDVIRDAGAMEGADALVLDAAREHFNSCVLLDEESLGLLMEILKLIPRSTPELKAELELIEATKRVQRMCPKIVPARVRLSKNRVELVEEILNHSPAYYAQMDEINEISMMLGLKSASQKQEVTLLVAQKAVQSKDWMTANRLCVELIRSGAKAVLKLSSELAANESNPDLNARITFLSYALIHCPVEELSVMLSSRNALVARAEAAKLRLPTDQSDAKEALGNLIGLAVSKGAEIPLDPIKSLAVHATSVNTPSSPSQRSLEEMRAIHQNIIRQLSRSYEVATVSASSCPSEAEVSQWLKTRDGSLKVLSLMQLRKDIAAFLAYAAEINDNEIVFTFLKEESSSSDLKHAEVSSTVACYFFALAFLSDVTLNRQVAQGFPKLPTHSVLLGVPPAQLVGVLVDGFFDSNVEVARLQQLLNGDANAARSLASLKRCRQFYVRLNDFVAVKELSERSPNIDIVRFGADVAYRNTIVLEQSHSLSDGALEKSLKMAQKYKVSRFDMLTEHVRWALVSGYETLLNDESRRLPNKIAAITESVSLLEASITPHLKELLSSASVSSSSAAESADAASASLLLAKLRAMVSEVNGTHYEALHFLFTLMRKSISGPANSVAVQKVEMILQLLAKLRKVSLARRLDFRVLLAPNAAAVMAELARNVDPQNVSLYARLVSALMALWKLDSKPEKMKEVESLTESFVYRSMLFTMTFGFAKPTEDAKKAVFIGRKGEEWSSLFEIMAQYLDKLDAVDLQQFAGALTVQRPSQLIAVATRLKFIRTVLASVSKTASPTSLAELQAIGNHLSMVEASEAALMNVEGVDVDAAVAAIDAAYRQPDTIASITSALIANGIGIVAAFAILDKLNSETAPLSIFLRERYSIITRRLIEVLKVDPGQDKDAFSARLREVRAEAAYKNKALPFPPKNTVVALLMLEHLVADLSQALDQKPKSIPPLLLEEVRLAVIPLVVELVEAADGGPLEGRLLLLSILQRSPLLLGKDKAVRHRHAQLLEALKSKAIVTQMSSSQEANVDVSEIGGKETLLAPLLAQLAVSQNDETDALVEKITALLNVWSEQPLEDDGSAQERSVVDVHALWFAFLEKLILSQRLDLVIRLLRSYKSKGVVILTEAEEDKLSSTTGLSRPNRVCLALLSSSALRRDTALNDYLNYVAAAKALTLNEDFNVRLFFLLVDEKLVTKIVRSKLFALLVDFLLAVLKRTSSYGALENSNDLLAFPMSDVMVTEYAAVRERSSEAVYWLAMSLATQLYGAQLFPWLSRLVLAYYRVSPSIASMDYANLLLQRLAHEIAARVDSLSDEERENERVRVALDFSRFAEEDRSR